jgi:hypothetical protein
MLSHLARARGWPRDQYTVRGKRYESATGPATLGTTAEAHLPLRTWCRNCRHSVDVDPGEQATRYGAYLPVPELAARLVCSQCGSRAVDCVVAPRDTGGAVR